MLLRFRIELSDVDRGVYEPLDLRVAMHPSEAPPFLLTRVLAFALNTQEGLEFAPGGLSDTDEPCIRALSLTGNLELAIEIGSPSAKRLHKTSKAAKHAKVYTYKDPDSLMREMKPGEVHRLEEIEFYSFDPRFLEKLAGHLEKDNRWNLLHTDGVLTVMIGSETIEGEVRRHSPH